MEKENKIKLYKRKRLKTQEQIKEQDTQVILIILYCKKKLRLHKDIQIDNKIVENSRDKEIFGIYDPAENGF